MSMSCLSLSDPAPSKSHTFYIWSLSVNASFSSNNAPFNILCYSYMIFNIIFSIIAVSFSTHHPGSDFGKGRFWVFHNKDHI
ncbi:hypothetical protein GDO81_016940 [Engystomops pustulosus]|uniref:Uncharacterized protein n=1 Tax=Engystomops pustulosus TaxID=76066 RepID=A0AAV7A9W6_ENGPU|nr:hypothetical protein GDO81_016940 [Engystomops pustulosus]